MFCPGCGVKEGQPLQFCRTCGADLRITREGLEQPDAATASAAAAREEIARAVAVKIKEGAWWQVAAMVPEVEKLFESPQERRLRLIRADEEKRLRLLRAGTITTAIGLGATLLFLILSMAKSDLVLLTAPSLLVFFIGLAIVINGLLFTVPKQFAKDRSLTEHDRDALDQASNSIKAELSEAQPLFSPSSVTEHTTKHLAERELDIKSLP